MIIYDDLALEAWTQRRETERDVGNTCVKTCDDLALGSMDSKRIDGREEVSLCVFTFLSFQVRLYEHRCHE